MTVVGTASPDATVSVNGILALPDTDGRFSVDLTLGPESNPLPIEVIATSIAGERRELVRHVISDASLSNTRGIFGTITAISGDNPGADAGEAAITIKAEGGPVKLTTTPVTEFQVPFAGSTAIESLSPGDSVAVLTSNDVVARILVRTGLPARTHHISGLITEVNDNGTISIRGPDGAQISALATLNIQELEQGSHVVAVLEQDQRSGALLITGLDPVGNSLARLQAALDQSLKSKSVNDEHYLSQRLTENLSYHLTVIRDSRGALASELEERAAGLARAHGVTPRLEISGIITSIDSQRGVIRITRPGGEVLDVSVGADTAFWQAPAGVSSGVQSDWLSGHASPRAFVRPYGGKLTSPEQLDLASRVRVRYDLESNTAGQVLVLPSETINDALADVLLSFAAPNTVTGTIVQVDGQAGGQTITIQEMETQKTVDLDALSDSRILEDGAPVTLNGHFRDSPVTASYDRLSLEIIELDSIPGAPGQTTVSGVVHSLVPKIVPNNMSILTPGGDIRTFSHTDSTIFRRNGVTVPINEVRLGDLVLGTSRYLTGGNGTLTTQGEELLVVSLESPGSIPIQGTIRGIARLPGGEIVVTLSTPSLMWVNLLVTSDTQLVNQGSVAGPDGLAIGQRVHSGSYHPLTSWAEQLTLTSPWYAITKGKISELDPQASTITITSTDGPAVRLLLPAEETTRVTSRSSSSINPFDLGPNTQVLAAVYDPVSTQLLWLVVP